MPTWTLSCRAPRSLARPRNIFFNQHPIVRFSPMSHGNTSQARDFPSPYPPSPALILPFHPSQWKEGVWLSGYQLLARSQPRPKARASAVPVALNVKLRGIKKKKKRNPWEGWGGYRTCFSCSVISHNASLPWVALWEEAWPVRITYFIWVKKN